MPLSGTVVLPALPRYTPLRFDANGISHVLAAQADTLVLQAALLERLASAPHAATLVLGAAPSPPRSGPAPRAYQNEDALAAALGDLLATAKLGTRLYLSGDEAFVWRLRGIAERAGMRPDEIQMAAAGARRAVYCVHCGAARAYGADDTVVCGGCGVRLGVRQHFSNALGAYLGVCADPDHPYAEPRT
jgi:dimethylamine monooxygenase subunit C